MRETIEQVFEGFFTLTGVAMTGDGLGAPWSLLVPVAVWIGIVVLCLSVVLRCFARAFAEVEADRLTVGEHRPAQGVVDTSPTRV